MGISDMLQRLLGTRSRKSPLMRDNPKYDRHTIGQGTYGMPEVRSWGQTKLIIGNYTSLADGVTILLGGEHNTSFLTTYPFNALNPKARHLTGHPISKGDIQIGSDVWIGTGALILSGVTIGDGAVIGARSVVASDVPPYSITAGNPARHIRYRFEEATVQALLAIKWWDWPLEKIEAELPLLMSDRTAEFIDRHKLK